MKFVAVCMLAAVVVSIPGEAKKVKRGVFGAFDNGYSSYAAGYQSPFYQIAPAYANIAPIAHYQPALVAHPMTHLIQHTHSIQRIVENFPIQAHRTIVKTISVDRPIPQPFPVVRHVALPYPVPIEHKIVKEIQVPRPYPIVQEHVKYVPVQRFVPQPYPVERQVPVYVHEQPQHVAVAQPIGLPEHQFAHAPLATSYGVPQLSAELRHSSLPSEPYYQEPVQALESYQHHPSIESYPQPQW